MLSGSWSDHLVKIAFVNQGLGVSIIQEDVAVQPGHKSGGTVEQHEEDNGDRIPHREDATHNPNTIFRERTPDTKGRVDEEGLRSMVFGVYPA